MIRSLHKIVVVITTSVLLMTVGCNTIPAVASKVGKPATKLPVEPPMLNCSGIINGKFTRNYGTINALDTAVITLDLSATMLPKSETATRATFQTSASSKLTIKAQNGETITVPVKDMGLINEVEVGGFDHLIVGAQTKLPANSTLSFATKKQYFLPSIIFSAKPSSGINPLVSLKLDHTRWPVFPEQFVSLSTSPNSGIQNIELALTSTAGPSFTCAVTPGDVDCDEASLGNENGIHDLSKYGALPFSAANQVFSDHAMQTAIHCAKNGDTIVVPRGVYAFIEPIEINAKTLTILGQGIDSGLMQTQPQKDLLRITDSVAPRIKDLFLGGRNAPSGTSPALLRLKLVRYGRFDNIVLQGSHTGIALEGSLSNSFYDIKSSANIPEPFDGCLDPVTNPVTFRCHNQQWIDSTDYIAPTGPVIQLAGLEAEDIASNANRWYNVQLEGGVDGFRYRGLLGQGGAAFYGGIISTSGTNTREGIAVDIANNGQPILFSGMHIEANNVKLNTTQNVTFDSTLISGVPFTPTTKRYTGRICITGATQNTAIHNSTVEAIDGAPTKNFSIGSRQSILNTRLMLANTCSQAAGVAQEQRCVNWRTPLDNIPIFGCK